IMAQIGIELIREYEIIPVEPALPDGQLHAKGKDVFLVAQCRNAPSSKTTGQVHGNQSGHICIAHIAFALYVVVQAQTQSQVPSRAAAVNLGHIGTEATRNIGPQRTAVKTGTDLTGTARKSRVEVKLIHVE